MSFVAIQESPLVPGTSPLEIHYREAGSGFVPLIFLHGGWGYEIYPFDSQIEEFGGELKIIIPDRSGYGRSMRISELPSDFHSRAATETLRVLDALGIDRAILWGHSDGAVISSLIGLTAPERCAGLILEAFHYYRSKPGSRPFFDTMAGDPGQLGERVSAALTHDHGEGYWEQLIRLNGRAWAAIADEDRAEEDLYQGRLFELRVPTLFVHGRDDPRTEPGEMEKVQSQLPKAEFGFIEGGGHSPHSERQSSAECNRIVRDFLTRIIADRL